MRFRTRHFASVWQRPKPNPDGSSLEEQMNDFLATLEIGKVADIQVATLLGEIRWYTGLIVYQED